MVNSYALLDQYIDFALNCDKYNSCIIKGRAGTGKTTIVLDRIREESKGNFVYLNGHLTPKEMFLCFKENSGSTIIFDDIDSLLSNKVALGLLKSATTSNLSGRRRIMYASSTSEASDIHVDFEGKTFMLCNHLVDNADVKAIVSRSVVYNFNPLNVEVIEEIKKFPDYDWEVVDYLSALFGLNNRLNFRHYFKAKELKTHFGDASWKDLVIPLLDMPDRYGLLDNILSNSSLSVEEQAKLYEESTGKSRASFFRHKKKVI